MLRGVTKRNIRICGKTMFIFLFYDHLVEIECVKSLNSGKHIAYPPGYGGKRKTGEVFRQCDKIATT